MRGPRGVATLLGVSIPRRESRAHGPGLAPIFPGSCRVSAAIGTLRRVRAAPVLLNPAGARRRSGGLTIIVPRGYEDGDVVIVGKCHVCGGEFGEGEEQRWQEHVGNCARAHMDEIRAMAPSEANKGTLWDPNEWDPEVDAHMLEVGRRMRREGRMVVKRSERAGFS